jgi:hypothetical protein
VVLWKKHEEIVTVSGDRGRKKNKKERKGKEGKKERLHVCAST